MIKSKKLDPWLDGLETDDANEIAAKLVRDELLTAWQAKYLLSGRHRLDIGSYRLLERLQRDELGDRFLAVHNQLGRKVDIQILPADLTRDKMQCDKFIEKSSQAAKLDHPNLMHVYDIDQEGGRYFLVTEHIKGVSLDQAPRETISDLDVARIMNRVSNGIQHAYENGVRHGDVTQRDVLLGEDGSIKVQNIAITPLRNPSNDADKRNDFQSIAVLAHGLLKQIQPSEDEGHRETLKSVITTMVKGDRASIGAAQTELSVWLADYDIEDFGTETEDGGLFDFAAETGGSFDAPTPAAKLNRPTSKKIPDASDSEKSKLSAKQLNPVSSFARRNPVAVLSLGFVVGLLLITGLSFLVFYLFRGEPASAVAGDPATGSPSSPSDSAAGNQENPEEESPFAELTPPVVATEDLKEPKTTEPETTPKPTPPVVVDPQPPAPKPEPPKPEPPKPEPPKPEPPQPEPVKPVVEVPPFQGLPQSADLPVLSDTTEVKIGDHHIPTQFLLALELNVPDGVAKSSPLFVIDRVKGDKQKWIVTARKREKDRGEEIATFRKSESAFYFQWLPDAEKSKIAGYLQNCMLKLKLSSEDTWLYLRSPIMIDPLVLTSDDLSSEIATEVDFLPDPKVLTAEVLDLNVEGTSLEPRYVELATGIPARILLMPEDSEPFVYVLVTLDVRSKLKANATMVLLATNRITPLKNFKDFEKTLQQVTQFAAKAQGEYQQLMGVQPQQGQKGALEKAQADLKRTATALNEQAQKVEQYNANATKLMNQNIGLRIYAKFIGHEIEIARTKPAK